VMNSLFNTKAMSVQHLWSCVGAGALVLVPALLLKKYAPIDQ
jgi:hypothetical protein